MLNRIGRKIFLNFSILIVLGVLIISCGTSGKKVVTLKHAHSHNDYEHEHPLFDALDHGFISIEADVHLKNGQLFVAHDDDEIKPENTFEKLYLAPLKKRIEENGGSLYGDGMQAILLVDLKTEAEPTYKAVEKQLEKYKEIFTLFDSTGRHDKAMIAIVSGERPREYMLNEKVRYAGYDGRFEDLDSDAPAAFIPLISDSWEEKFTWMGNGEMPADQWTKLKTAVDEAHAKGRIIRFWALPEKPTAARLAVWKKLTEAHVDLIGSDDLDALQKYLLKNYN